MQYNTNGDMARDNYNENLRHMAEPATPDERERAVSISLEDYQALYLASMLREWAAYHAPDDEQASIAKGYVEFIDKQVRDQDEYVANLYAHTRLASEVITDAIYDYHHAYREQVPSDVFKTLEETIIDLWAGQHAEQVNKDAGREEYDLPPEQVEVVVEDGREVVTETVERTEADA